jgi:hypothetical protein
MTNTIMPDAYGTVPAAMAKTMSPLDIHNKKIQKQKHLEGVNTQALNVPIYDARSLTANVKLTGGTDGVFLMKAIEKGNPKISFQNPTIYNRTKTNNGKHISSISAFVTNERMLPHMTFNGKTYWLFPKSIGDEIVDSDRSIVTIPMRDGKSYMFNINDNVEEAFDPQSVNYAKALQEKSEGGSGMETVAIVLGVLFLLAAAAVYIYPMSENKVREGRVNREMDL